MIKTKHWFLILGVIFTITAYTLMFDFLKNNQFDIVLMFQMQYSTNYGAFFLLDLLVALIVYLYWISKTSKIKKNQKMIAVALIFIIGLAASACYVGYIVSANKNINKQ